MRTVPGLGVVFVPPAELVFIGGIRVPAYPVVFVAVVLVAVSVSVAFVAHAINGININIDNAHRNLQQMAEKNSTQLIDKTTRNRIFNCRYWKEECFALNAETLIDKAVQIKCVGGLYGGAKKPTKFLCLVFKMLQMNLSREIVEVYLGERDYKYLTAMALLYLRLTTKAPDVYLALEPFYVDNRKLRLRNSIGRLELTYIDKFVEELLSQEIFFGLALPFIPKRLALQIQGVLDPRKSLIEEQLNTNNRLQGERPSKIEQDAEGEEQDN